MEHSFIDLCSRLLHREFDEVGIATGFELDVGLLGCKLDRSVILVKPDTAADRALRMQHHSDHHLLTRLGVRRRDESLEVDFISVLIPERDDVDGDAVGAGPSGLGQNIPHVVIAVGHQHDPLGGVMREHGHRQPKRRRNIRSIRIGHLGKSAGRNEVAAAHRQLLQVGVSGEGDHSHQILGRHLGGCLLDELLLVLLQRLNAIGPVHQKDNRQLVIAPDLLYAGQADRHEHDQRAARNQGQHPSGRVQTGETAQGGQDQHRHQQANPQPGRLIKIKPE